MPLDARDIIIRTLEDEMISFDAAVEQTTTARASVIERMTGFVNQIDTLNFEDPKGTAARMDVIRTALSALADQEAAATRRVTAKLRHHESKRADNTSELVIKLLQDLSTSTNTLSLPPLDLDHNSLDLERSLMELGQSIDEGELRPDPNDLH